MDFIEHAEYELKNIGYKGEPVGENDQNHVVYTGIMDIVKRFDEMDIHGIFADYTVCALERLLRHCPLSPLTGEDDEWIDASDSLPGCWQNKRYPHVYKDSQKAWDDQAIIFIDPNGYRFTDHRSRRDIDKFPYSPAKEYVEVVDQVIKG